MPESGRAGSTDRTVGPSPNARDSPRQLQGLDAGLHVVPDRQRKDIGSRQECERIAHYRGTAPSRTDGGGLAGQN